MKPKPSEQQIHSNDTPNKPKVFDQYAVNKMNRLIDFSYSKIRAFQHKMRHQGRNAYFTDADFRMIMDKLCNDMLLCAADICAEVLKIQHKPVLETYKDNIEACSEYLGKGVHDVANLMFHRNNIIHYYMQINWKHVDAIYKNIEHLRALNQAAIVHIKRLEKQNMISKSEKTQEKEEKNPSAYLLSPVE